MLLSALVTTFLCSRLVTCVCTVSTWMLCPFVFLFVSVLEFYICLCVCDVFCFSYRFVHFCFSFLLYMCMLTFFCFGYSFFSKFPSRVLRVSFSACVSFSFLVVVLRVSIFEFHLRVTLSLYSYFGSIFYSSFPDILPSKLLFTCTLNIIR